MKVLHINSYDTKGGAARAVYRLHNGMRHSGINSKILVQKKNSDDFNIIGPKSQLARVLGVIKPWIDRCPLYLYSKPLPPQFHIQFCMDSLLSAISEIDPDIVHLHWICDGFVRIGTLAHIKKPIVWTLHDVWAFTGGCHYSFECRRYEQSCGKCPQLGGRFDFDMSRWTWTRKNRTWKNLNLHIVTPSFWLKECAQKSALLKNYPIDTIFHGLDLDTYRVTDPSVARQIMKLPNDKTIILFGAFGAASDPRKGFHDLLKALHQLPKKIKESALLVIFGASEPETPSDFGLPARYVGYVHDDITLSLIYAAADVMIVPSRQEAFGQTASEALACGLPVVAFNTTGLKDIVDHKITGYLAIPYNISDLSSGIEWILEDKNRWKMLSQHARKKAEDCFNDISVAERYLHLYQKILGSR